MNFEQRKEAAKDLVMDFLDAYSPPRGVSDDGLTKKIILIADAFARHMPTKGDFAENCEKVFQKIRDTHMSNTWPSQAEFVMVMPASEALMKRTAESYKPEDPWASIAEKMKGRAPVPEAAIWSGQASSFPNLDSYRAESVASWVSLYSADARAKMMARYGHVVLPYFQQMGARA